MGFDYVLAHPDCHYLATETEKLHYFQSTLGLDPSSFPARLYRSKHTRSKTARSFVDKFPIFLPGARSVRLLWSRFATSTAVYPNLRASTRT
jgi:hypothetical protein